jgi:hypothetical protein
MFVSLWAISDCWIEGIELNFSAAFSGSTSGAPP